MKKLILVSFVSFLSIFCFAGDFLVDRGSGSITTKLINPIYTGSYLIADNDFSCSFDTNYVFVGTSTNYDGSQENVSQLTNYSEMDIISIYYQKVQLRYTIENQYVAFLTNDWTGCLRSYGVISNSASITVQNTSEGQNMVYLLTIRVADTNALKPTYSYYAGEFERFKYSITSLGGTMSQVTTH